MTSYSPMELAKLSGNEEILPGVKIIDFWAWALGDLRLNSTRGMLAQFLVARAVGDTRLMDDGWGDFDIESAENIKIEVKSSGYLQSWAQKKPSSIVFSGLIGRTWSASEGYSESRQVRADVFVFAVHKCQVAEDYDPLDLSSWDFYVIPGTTIRDLNQRSMNLNRVRSLAAGNAVMWGQIHAEVLRAAKVTDADL